MTRGTLYDGRRQYQGRRPARTPAQSRRARKLGYWIAGVTLGLACFCGGALATAAMWLLGWMGTP